MSGNEHQILKAVDRRAISVSLLKSDAFEQADWAFTGFNWQPWVCRFCPGNFVQAGKRTRRMTARQNVCVRCRATEHAHTHTHTHVRLCTYRTTCSESRGGGGDQRAGEKIPKTSFVYIVSELCLTKTIYFGVVPKHLG